MQFIFASNLLQIRSSSAVIRGFTVRLKSILIIKVDETTIIIFSKFEVNNYENP